MILYVMLHGKEPWEIVGPNDLLDNHLKPFPISNDLSDDVKDFLKQTITGKATRLTVEEAINHRFIRRIMNNSFTAEKYSMGLESG
jgi:hypothetical protein